MASTPGAGGTPTRKGGRPHNSTGKHASGQVEKGRPRAGVGGGQTCVRSTRRWRSTPGGRGRWASSPACARSSLVDPGRAWAAGISAVTPAGYIGRPRAGVGGGAVGHIGCRYRYVDPRAGAGGGAQQVAPPGRTWRAGGS